MNYSESIIRDQFEDDVIIIKSCNPNNHGTLGLVQSADGYHVVIEVTASFGYGDGESEVDVLDFSSQDAARCVYDEHMENCLNTPNWGAQSEYDELHGTINGEDAGITAMRELWEN